MKKMAIPSVFFSVFIFLIFGSVQARTLDLNVQVFVCTDDRYLIRYTVRNNFTYDKHPIIAFKVLKGDEVIACKRVSLTIPAGHDGSEVHEVSLDAPCFQDEKVSLSYRIFPRVVQNKVGPWLSDCP